MKTGLKVFLHIVGTFVCLFLTSWFFGLFECTTKSEYFRVFSDACFITGGVFVGLGLVSFAIKAGMYDTLGRASRLAEENQTIEEFNKEKQGKRRWLRILTFCGVACILAANVFSFLC